MNALDGLTPLDLLAVVCLVIFCLTVLAGQLIDQLTAAAGRRTRGGPRRPRRPGGLTPPGLHGQAGRLSRTRP